MNRFLNENWRELNKDIGPTIAEAVNQISLQIMENIYALVPYEEAFPDTK